MSSTNAIKKIKPAQFRRRFRGGRPSRIVITTREFRGEETRGAISRKLALGSLGGRAHKGPVPARKGPPGLFAKSTGERPLPEFRGGHFNSSIRHFGPAAKHKRFLGARAQTYYPKAVILIALTMEISLIAGARRAAAILRFALIHWAAREESLPGLSLFARAREQFNRLGGQFAPAKSA